ISLQPVYRSRLPDDDPRLWTAEKLVTAHHDHRRTCGKCLTRCWLARQTEFIQRQQQTASEIVNDWNAMPGCDRRALRNADVGNESGDRKIAAVNLRDHSGSRADGSNVVI